ncbi:YciI family protein [Aeoliella sp. ICT_H6.2]|uniref:YciI family protein n=1 Tax=Aeoliella straminimaris TaxID=2954799 RepID=A0A9X2JIG7_9BACT|nr:YciI family protein [Aeoliella straminimaris]MCO6047050.1 YciI family protein [Aeoliella straminimaris]
MKFICLGYCDESKFEDMAPEEFQEKMDECFAYDDELRRGGHFLGGEALQSVRDSVALELVNGQVSVIDGPFVETKEQLGGILLLEARDLNHAIALMSKHPGIQFGHWEIRPADETINALVAERDAKFSVHPS